MRTKTKYRPIESENNIPIEKELPPVAVIAEPQGPGVAVAVESQPQGEQPKPQAADEPALALSKQLEALKQSEELQRQLAAQLQQQPITREQKLDLWRRQGLSDAEAHFLQQHPEMIDFPQIANAAAAEAMQAGHKRDSEAYWKATEMIFDNQLNRMRAQATPSANPEPTPAFFQPPPPPAPPTRTNIYSAPVSRSIPGSREPDLNPRQMILSAEEIEIAKASGISATEYAKNKLRLQAEKRAGLRD